MIFIFPQTPLSLFQLRPWIGCAEQDLEHPWLSLVVGHGHVVGRHHAIKGLVPVEEDCLLTAETICPDKRTGGS